MKNAWNCWNTLKAGYKAIKKNRRIAELRNRSSFFLKIPMMLKKH